MPQYANRSKSSQDISETKARALVALGANMPSRFGTPAETIRSALRRLEATSLHVEKVSRLFSTPSFPANSDPDYVNAAATVSGIADAHAVLNVLNAIEDEFGRRRGARWGSRTLDLDLIAFGSCVLPDVQTYRIWRDLSPESQRFRVPRELILPHTRMQDRACVLGPLLEIAPEWKHPVAGLTVAQMHETLHEGEKAAVMPLRTES